MEHHHSTSSYENGAYPAEVLKYQATVEDGIDHDSAAPEYFLRTKGPQIHPIFDEKDAYLQQRTSARAQHDFHQDTVLHTNQFLEAMEVYQAAMKEKGMRAFDIRGKHSWDEVLQTAKDAEAAYLKASGKWYKKAGIFTTMHAEAVVPWLGIIPNNFCLSAIAGGLKLIFKAAVQISERRDKVLKSLLRIPHVITQAEHRRETFPEDKVLYDRAEAVYLAALTAIEGIIKSLLQKSSVQAARALILGPLYNKSYEAKIQDLNGSLDALQERVSELRDEAILRTEKLAVNVEKVVISTDETVSAMTEDIKLLTQSHEDSNIKIGQMQDLEKVKEEANRAMRIVLDEANKNAQWKQKNDRVIRRLKFQIRELEKSSTAMNRDDLLGLLAVPSEVPGKDLQRILKGNEAPELSAYHIAQIIITHKKFQVWQSTDESAALFVETQVGMSSICLRRNGPLPTMSSMVIDSLSNMDPAIPIYFFCGAHTMSSDPIQGPRGMMRSLISQILRLFSVDLDFISTSRYRKELESLSLATLCDAFVKIVKRLPLETVLFCIIDSVSFFERNEWADDCRKVLSNLQDLTSDDEPAAVFKLLLTSPLRSKFAGNMFENRISICTGDSGSRNAPTERQYSMASRRGERSKTFRPSFGSARWSEDELDEVETSTDSEFWN